MGTPKTRNRYVSRNLNGENGDRYMVVAHNPIVKKAISKEKLTKRGLVSLSDYYLKVALS